MVTLRFATGVLAVFVSVSFFVWYGAQMRRVEETAVVNILASREPSLGLSVFAQFTVTQTLKLDSVARVSKLIVPMYMKEAGRVLQIDLRRNGSLVERWRYKTGEADRVVEVELRLMPPQLLDGELEVFFSGDTISHEDKENAPRLFMESDDRAYPNGNYRVADNEKKGDIGLAFYGQQKHWERLLAEWEKGPMAGLLWVGVRLLLFILIIIFPVVTDRVFFKAGV